VVLVPTIVGLYYGGTIHLKRWTTMADQTVIDVNGKVVSVKLMDDSWIINQCAGGHPFKPRAGVVWSESDRCARLRDIPGSNFQEFLQGVRRAIGNCAAIAWQDRFVLGHLVWIPRSTARTVRASGWEFFGPPEEDDRTLIVVNLAFCSLSGHEFRCKGVGKAMVDRMVAWAREHAWRAIEVYDVPAGLFPSDWFDWCIPPKPFWEGRNFDVLAHRPQRYCDEDLTTLLQDNPRNSEHEQTQKQQIVAEIQAGMIDQSRTGHFDLRLVL
jgi:hypothetical protein